MLTVCLEQRVVVADHDQPALVRLEELAQPDDRVGVEVVGGLVEEQRLGAGEEDPGQLDAAALTTREGLELLGEDALLDPEAAGDRGGLGLGGVPAPGVQLGVGALVAAHRLLADRRVVAAHVGLGLAQPAYDVVETARGQDPVAREDLGVADARVLRQVADLAGRLHRAGGGLCLAGEDLGERRLAGAVASDETDLVAGSHPEADVLHEQACSGTDFELVGGDHEGLKGSCGYGPSGHRRRCPQSRLSGTSTVTSGEPMRFNPKARLDTSRMGDAGRGSRCRWRWRDPDPWRCRGRRHRQRDHRRARRRGQHVARRRAPTTAPTTDTDRYQQCESGEDANTSADCARVAIENSLTELLVRDAARAVRYGVPARAEDRDLHRRHQHRMRFGELRRRPLLLPRRPDHLPRHDVLRRRARAAARRPGRRLRRGLRAGPRVRPPHPEPARHDGQGQDPAGGEERRRTPRAPGGLLRRDVGEGRHRAPRTPTVSRSSSR